MKSNFGFTLLILISIVLSYSTILGSNNPSFSGKLIYLKVEDAETQIIVQRSHDETRSFRSESDCIIPSPVGDLIAVYESDLQMLRVYQFTDSTIIWEKQVELPSGCRLSWISADLLLFEDVQQRQTIDLITGRIEAVVIPASSVELPLKPTSQRVIYSPDGRWAVYNQCPSNTFYREGSLCQGGEEQAVIYDLGNRTVAYRLEDFVNGSLAPLHLDIGLTGRFAPFWSPSGRYLFYYTTDSTIPFRIFDLQVGEAFDLALDEQTINLNLGFQWSNDESHLGYWLEESAYDPNYEVTAFQTLALEGGKQQTYPARFTLSPIWQWSPDQGDVAFVADAGALIQLDLDTGTSTELDQDVILLYGWVE